MMEREIIQKAQKGHPEAYSQLVRYYSHRVYLTVYQVLRNVEDAKDVTQDIFTELLDKLKLYNPEYPFYPWLFRIAKNKSLNFIKRKENHNQGLVEEIRSQYETPEEVYRKKETKRELWKAIDQLDSSSREILMLQYMQECSYKEIAQILDIPIGTVMSRLFNGRQKLRDILERGEV